VATAINRAAAPALEPAPNRFYLPELDSLRFFAFLGVFIAHVSPISSLRPLYALPIFAAGFGVDLFFTLSAFLITELLMREKERFGSLNVGAFYTRRILRIWPLYFTYVAAVFCTQWIYLRSEYPQDITSPAFCSSRISGLRGGSDR
jgi:peptidoglycan/LPS O-acetylase OafA/YrhL